METAEIAKPAAFHRADHRHGGLLLRHETPSLRTSVLCFAAELATELLKKPVTTIRIRGYCLCTAAQGVR